MKNIISYFVLAACFALIGVSQAQARQRELLLSGSDWQIASFDPGEGTSRRAFAEGYPTEEAIAAVVPGDVHWDLERAGKIPPIYHGVNSGQIHWVAGKEWWYRKTFQLGKDWKGQDVRLKFDAVDYAAKAWLNGRLLGSHKGQFTPFEFDTTDAIKVGDKNVLTVMIEAAPPTILKLLPTANQANHQPCQDEMSRSLKFWKSRVVTGWDFSIPLWSAGIWQDVRLVADGGARIDQVLAFPEINAPYDKARIKTKVRLSSKCYRECEMVYHAHCITGEASETKAVFPVSIHESGQLVEFPVDISRPKLWWPNGYGDQNLYELRITLKDRATGAVLDEASSRFGIRDLKILANPQPRNGGYTDYWYAGPKDGAFTGWSSGWKEWPKDKEQKYLISINGRRIFARGANLLPTDMLFGRSGRERYEHLIRMAAMGNNNVFRIWGGGLIEKRIFYDLCDEYGIMVWQEMPHAALPLETPEALARAAAQQRDVMALLINHPCVVRYGFGNELYMTSDKSSQVEQFENICREMDPTRPCYAADPVCSAQRHAPWYFSFPPGSPGEAWPDAYAIYNTGASIHAGPVKPIEWTEYGASGLSCVETLKRIIPAGDLWPVGENAFWNHHHAPKTGWWLMPQIYRSLFKELKDLDAEVRASQFAQAEGLRYADQAQRRHKWRRSACVSWTFNEPWPNAAHGCIVEYYGQPKMAYYYARDAYAEVDVSAEYGSLYLRSGSPMKMKLYVTSERQGILKHSTVSVKIMDLDGKLLHQQQWACNAAAEAVTPAGELSFTPPKELEGKVILVAVKLRDEKGARLSSHVYTFGVIGADLNAPAPNGYMNNLFSATKTDLAIAVSPEPARDWYGKKARCYAATVSNAGPAPALFVRIEATLDSGKPVYIEDNYFTLLPGEKREFHLWIPELGDTKDRAVPRIRAKAWNSKTTAAN